MFPLKSLIIFCLFILIAGLTPADVRAQEDEQARIRQLVQQFFTTYAQEDIDGVMALWSEKANLQASREGFLKVFQDYRNIEVNNLVIEEITVTASDAKVLVKLELAAVDAKSGKPAENFIKGNRNRTLHLVKEDEQWKLRQYVATEEELADRLLAIKTEGERQALFDANKDLHTRVLMLAFRRERFSKEGNLTQALHVYRLMQAVAESLGENESIAVSSHILGFIQYSQGDLVAALGSYDKAEKFYETIGDKRRRLELLNDIGQLHYVRAHHSLAHEYFKKSLAISEELGDKKKIALVLNSIGALYSALGDYAEGLEYYRRSLALCEETKDQQLISTPLSNIGSIYRILGNNALAMEYYQRSLALAEALNDKWRAAFVLSNIGQIHHSQGNYSQALEYLQKALAMAQAGGFKADVAIYEGLIGNVHMARKDYAPALVHYEKSLSLNESVGQNSATVATLQSIGNVHHFEGRIDRALEYFKRSLRLAEQLKEPAVTAGALIGLGNIYLAQNNNQAALAAGERALALSAQMQKADVAWMSHNLIGRAQRALGQLEPARRSFDAAIDWIERMRAGVAGGEQESRRFLEDKLAPYHSIIELLLATKNYTDALTYAERAKGRTLLDVLSSGRVNVVKAMTKEEDERERTLHGQIVTLNSQLFKAEQQHNQPRSTEIKAQLEKARLEYEAFQANLYAAHPELRVQRGQSQVLTLAEAEKLLPHARAAILQYVVTESESYLFVIARHAGKLAVTVHTLGSRSDKLATATESFRQQVATRDLLFNDSAQQLYDLLIKPAAKQLRGINTLIIVPDGPLWDLPFQALAGDKRYLLDDFVVSYAPSLSVLREMKRKWSNIYAPASTNARLSSPKPAYDLLALGNPELNVLEVAKLSMLRAEDLGPLTSAETEVNTIGQLYGRKRSKVLVRERATEDEAKADAEKYRLLHVAAHAVLDDRNPMYSRIMLSRGEKREDGMLEAWELMKLDLKAEMVVLSACQTARGRVGAGEGMIGMSWALFVAGSPAVVVSQWKVDSERTSELMIEFHRNLVRRGGAMTKAEALRLAALQLRRGRYSHPFYWAGFVLIGNER
jgi:CHAT domain-containing protein/Tfp pilus assembly protein PilF/ketosteroid isomerase-like protein